ncbi:putative RNA-directed DNA polymerase from transposon BS [Caerostris darwini]|uniref:RNA-directed DNA polymerase from transposon BS n=1 Tax=Caerostris darwini TaxID=1538125 RepID=A0AAV4VIK3_9ARAC|nr:putative RNA-directed DNA polymerase from transposon BS [Caerostris darwini]
MSLMSGNSNENEVTMEDSTPEVKDDKGPKTTTQNSTGPRPVSPSGVKISDDFVYENFQLISELHVFQSQLEYLHNCMQAASSSDHDNQLVAQTNALVQKVEELIKVIKFIKTMNPKKASGIDNINANMIRFLPNKYLWWWVIILNELLNLNYFPNAWKTALISPIFKPGTNPKLPANYRPISVLSNLSKIYEHVILSRLNH